MLELVGLRLLGILLVGIKIKAETVFWLILNKSCKTIKKTFKGSRALKCIKEPWLQYFSYQPN